MGHDAHAPSTLFMFKPRPISSILKAVASSWNVETGPEHGAGEKTQSWKSFSPVLVSCFCHLLAIGIWACYLVPLRLTFHFCTNKANTFFLNKIKLESLSKVQ